VEGALPTNAILTRIVTHLAEHLAQEAEVHAKAGPRVREPLPRRNRVGADAERDR
jgi:hypothetical protein